MTIPRGLCALLLFFGAVALVGSGTVRAQNANGPTIHLHSAMKFGPLPNVPACVTGASERGNPMTEASTLLVHFRRGCRVPWHWHTAEEAVMIVNGTLRVQMKGGAKAAFLHQGDYALMPAHDVHEAQCVGAITCTLFIQPSGAFDIHYVNSAGKEIPLSEAVKPAAKTHAKTR